MIYAIEVDLAARGLVFPGAGVGMVVAQPYLELANHEPYTCTPASKQRQLDAIASTLHVSRQASHGADKTHFTVFPECCIPGLHGVAAIDAAVAAADWPTGTVVIGGVDALSREEFVALAGANATHLDAEHNSLDRVQAHEWVNCCITWIKLPDGSVERWLQPKIAPAWVEQDVKCLSMFQGKSVFVFRGPFDDHESWFRFCSLLCYDWVADVDGKRVWRWVVEGLGTAAHAVNAQFALTWLFVVQYNPGPSHASFLTQVDSFFDQTVQKNVPRNHACLVMANAAGRAAPGRTDKFGSTAVVHSEQAPFDKPTCSVTYGNGGQRQRASTQLGRLKDALFRERGACIHSFYQRNPASIVPGAAGRTFAVVQPYVYPLGNPDPRAPAAPVPASVKWLNDDLDDVKGLAVKFPGVALSLQAAHAHATTVSALRGIESLAVESAIKLACPTCGKSTADEWDSCESNALEHVLQTLTVLGVGKATPNIQGQPTHATIALGARTLDVVAIRASSHEECSKHIKRDPPMSRRPIIVISRDEDNTEWPKRMQSFLDTPQENKDDANVTDPTGAVRYVGYRTILDAFRGAQTEDQLSGELNVVLTA